MRRWVFGQGTLEAAKRCRTTSRKRRSASSASSAASAAVVETNSKRDQKRASFWLLLWSTPMPLSSPLLLSISASIPASAASIPASSSQGPAPGAAHSKVHSSSALLSRLLLVSQRREDPAVRVPEVFLVATVWTSTLAPRGRPATSTTLTRGWFQGVSIQRSVTDGVDCGMNG